MVHPQLGKSKSTPVKKHPSLTRAQSLVDVERYLEENPDKRRNMAGLLAKNVVLTKNDISDDSSSSDDTLNE